LITSIIYLLIGLAVGCFDRKNIIKLFCYSSQYLNDSEAELNKVFAPFVKACHNASISELLPFVQYSSRFFKMELDLKVPESCKDVDSFKVIQILIKDI